jgi:hypothetical protein
VITPQTPKAVEIGTASNDEGLTLGVLSFKTDEGVFSFLLDQKAADTLQEALDRVRPLINL